MRLAVRFEAEVLAELFAGVMRRYDLSDANSLCKKLFKDSSNPSKVYYQ